MNPRWKGLFVTGTDTDVGKTETTAAVLRALAGQGCRAVGYKPVAAGAQCIDGRWVNDDVLRLQRASSVEVPLEAVGPCVFRAPCAPHMAARREGRALELASLVRGADHLATLADVVVVEGVGGFCVPLKPDGPDAFDTADLAVVLRLPVVLVVGLRLGCINHALLTAEAVWNRGLSLVGWIGNSVKSDWADQRDNIEALETQFRERWGVPCLGVLPHMDPPDANALARHLDAAALMQWVRPSAVHAEPKGLDGGRMPAPA